MDRIEQDVRWGTPASVRLRKPARPRAWGELAKHAFMILVCLLLLYPFALMLQMSVKDTEQIMYEFFRISSPYHFDNYARAWSEVGPMIKNSVVMAGGSALISIFITAAAGYGFGKLKFPGKEPLYWIVFAKMMLPGVMNLIPSFVLAWKLGLLNSYWAVILFAVGGAQPFWVFVMRTFVAGQPQELFDSAKVDGAGEARIFWHIALPLLRPVLSLSALNVFLGVWNDYIWPLVTIQSFDKRPITTGLAYLSSTHVGDYGPLMAGYVIASVPLFLLFAFGMKQFVQGLTGGAVKL
ncbi:carbohydrate ABC transporter permease [Paenibacillus arenilitoris]|uniref:Carbohydrate ABC transporter permease n=1 Tax=Paenibacillus arenilitoris TaxID=2772299 RepID=A0A927H498_9BACL|nr:carbohydrate ABC transporter permease [Paenibacillus arenilitoris]MBD2867152.1 carbohydrate ABC transporter permease [Paenibacillus arenilitoris]